MKLLGVFIDKGVNFSTHVDEVVKKCNSKIYGLPRLPHVSSEMTHLSTFHESIIVPMLVLRDLEI